MLWLFFCFCMTLAIFYLVQPPAGSFSFLIYSVRLFYHVRPSATYFLAFAPKSRQKRRLRGCAPKNPAVAGIYVKASSCGAIVCFRLSSRNCNDWSGCTSPPATHLRVTSCCAGSAPARAPFMWVRKRIQHVQYRKAAIFESFLQI